MAQIPEFSVAQGRQAAGAVRVTPSEEGIQTLQQGARNISRLTNERAQYTAQAGRDIGRGLGQIGTGLEDVGKQVEQHQTLQEISSMGPSYANMLNGVVDQMHDAIQSNDPAAIQKFRDNLETQLDQWQSQAVTKGAQAHAITQVDQLRNHILGTWLPAEMAQAAYHKTQTDLGSMANTFTSITTNKPETLPASLSMLGSQIDAMVANHTLTPGSSEELKGLKQKIQGQVVAATINSVIRGNPDAGITSNPSAARQMVKTYGPYLSPEQQQHLISEADAQDKALEVQSRSDEAEQRRQQRDAANQALTGAITGMMQPDGTLRVGPNTVHDVVAAAGMPEASPGEAKAAMTMIDSLTQRAKSGKDVVSDPATLASLQQKALSGDLTPQELYQNAPKLSQKDLSNTYTMMERINKAGPEVHNDNELIKQSLSMAQGQLAAATGGQYIAGMPSTPAFIRFQTWFNSAVAKAQRDGKLDQFALDLANKPPEFWKSFSQTAPNPGSGLATGLAPITPGNPPPTPAQPEAEGLLHKWFGIGQ